ncbi:MAG: DegT/DnrJ/EryC1/StrS family aminotransferase [Bdellovibrionaceae bacterium]|nr:DegT/DnrJ/EryC1/StrS family aminotransferase [Pseudobdellovibrionaceae bacterium]
MKIPLNTSTFDDLEINAAIDVLRSGFLTMGERCFKFEDEFSKYIGSRNAVYVNSGSSANLMAFFALTNPMCPKGKFGGQRLMPGDEVIVPAVTWSTTIWPVVQAGLVPVLVDSDPYTLQMDINSVKKAITGKTRAICPVHVLGNSVALQELQTVAKENKLWLIEDTCESLGTRYDGKYVGTFGDIGTYSFFFSHHITTIEGGMIVTDNDEMAELFRAMRAHGWTRHLKNRQAVEQKYPDIDPRFLFITTGFNLRPTEINAAFGMQQLKKLEGFNQARRDVTDFWIKELSPIIKTGAFKPMQIVEKTVPTWFGFPIICESNELRNRFQKHLESNGIETRPVICGNLARQPAMKAVNHRVAGDLTGADTVMDRGLFWGSHPMMTNEEKNYVLKIVKEFFT